MQHVESRRFQLCSGQFPIGLDGVPLPETVSAVVPNVSVKADPLELIPLPLESYFEVAACDAAPEKYGTLKEVPAREYTGP